MNVRFAEPCRESHLEHVGFERQVMAEAVRDGRTPQERLCACSQDIFIGVFFDGTNNNKFRDTPGHSHSNVARLYEAFPGSAAEQTAPSLKRKVLPDGSTEPRPIFKEGLQNPPSRRESCMMMSSS
jgi:hypothetical protein